MDVLEKILEEIEHESKLAHEEMRRCASKNPLQFDEVKGYARGVEYAVDIIRSHMDDGKDINVNNADAPYITLTLNENGVAEVYDDTYDVTVHCESEEE